MKTLYLIPVPPLPPIDRSTFNNYKKLAIEYGGTYLPAPTFVKKSQTSWPASFAFQDMLKAYEFGNRLELLENERLAKDPTYSPPRNL